MKKNDIINAEIISDTDEEEKLYILKPKKK